MKTVTEQMRDSLNMLDEYVHRKPKSGNPDFEDWDKLFGKDWTRVQQNCRACGSTMAIDFLVRDIDWHNICPKKYNREKREGRTVWVDETDPELKKVRGEKTSASGEDGVICLTCFDYYAALADMDYEITHLFFVGLRQSIEIDVDKVKFKKHTRREMYDSDYELKPGIRHPDYPDAEFDAGEDGLLKSQTDRRNKFAKK